MKLSILAGALLAVPTISFAKDNTVSAERAASFVRQAGIEKCLATVETYKGSAYFDKITNLGTTVGADSSTTRYKLEGSNLMGDVMTGSWEIIVTELSEEIGNTYDCKISKNEE